MVGVGIGGMGVGMVVAVVVVVGMTVGVVMAVVISVTMAVVPEGDRDAIGLTGAGALVLTQRAGLH